MLLSTHSENHIVRGQADFHQHLAPRHLAKQADGVAFIHDAGAVPDALGVSLFDGLADVEGQAFRRNQAHGQFAGVQADVHLGIDAVQVVEHLHVQIEIVHGHIPVFRHHQVETNEARVGLGQLEAEQDLREDLLPGKAAQDLIQISDFDGAAGIGLGRAATQNLAHGGFVAIQFLAGGGNHFLETTARSFSRSLEKSSSQPTSGSESCRLHAVGGVHEFEVLQVVGGGA